MHLCRPTKLFVAFVALFSCNNLHAKDDGQAVELFTAIDSGLINVRFIPADAHKANVLIQNVSDQVLQVELPDAIAAVPVLAQFAPAGRNGGGPAGGGGTQSVGGGLNFGGPNAAFHGGGGGNAGGVRNPGFNNFNGGGQRNGGGFMRIAPAKSRKLTARTVCLEHGKPDPNPRVAYQMIPIDRFTDDPAVAELCRQIGRGRLPQRAAQAAAWRLANGLSWEQIAAFNRVESRYLGNTRYFEAGDLAIAKSLVSALSSSAPGQDDYADAR